GTERPEGSPMAVFGALVFEPTAVIAHEVSEPACIRVPGVFDEGCEGGCHPVRYARLADGRQERGQKQGSRVVIDAIAMRPVRHGEHRMLDDARVVAHRVQMAKLQSCLLRWALDP